MRILGAHACVHILTPVAVWPSIESAFAHGSEIVGDEVWTEFVPLVYYRPKLARPWLDGKSGGIPKASGERPVRPSLDIHLPHHRPVDFGKHAAFRDVAVGP